MEMLNIFKKSNKKEDDEDTPIPPPPPIDSEKKDMPETEDQTIEDIEIPEPPKSQIKPITEPQKQIPETQEISKLDSEKIIEEPYKTQKIDPDYIEMRAYVKYNLYYGQNSKSIYNVLLKSGWDKKQIDKAFSEVLNKKKNLIEEY